MQILGIDFGLSKIGLAIAQDGWVKPLKVISNSSLVIEKINKICQDEEIEMIVLGLPEGRLVEPIREFARRLGQFVGLKVVLQDEDLTTHQAIVKMQESGNKKRELEDAYAAAWILEEYLEERRNNV